MDLRSETWLFFLLIGFVSLKNLLANVDTLSKKIYPKRRPDQHKTTNQNIAFTTPGEQVGYLMKTM